MPVRLKEWDKNETGWTWIEVTDNKVINLILRDENNLIQVNEDNEVYTDLQLESWISTSDTLPVWITTGRVLQADGRPATWTLTCSKTTSGDYTMYLYGDNGIIYVDNGTWVWKTLWNAFFKTQAEYNALPATKTSDWNLYIIVDSHLNTATLTFVYDEDHGTVTPDTITVQIWTEITGNGDTIRIGEYPVIATGLNGYYFSGWSCNEEPGLPQYVTEDLEITAAFSIDA